MPLPRRLATLNRVGLNKIMRNVAPRLPGLGVVEHVGRRSAKAYRTPVNVFFSGGEYVLALTYGQGDWVRNVLAAGGCTLRTRGRTVTLRNPRIVHDESRRRIRFVERRILGWLDVSDFLVLDPAD